MIKSANTIGATIRHRLITSPLAMTVLIGVAGLLLTSCEPLKPPKITSLNPHEVLKQLISYASQYISANEEPSKKISGKFFREYNPKDPTENYPAGFDRDSPPIIFNNTIILTTSDHDIICITTDGKGLWMQQGKRPLTVERSGNFLVCTYRRSVPDLCVLNANTGEPVWEYLLDSHNQVDNLTDLVIDVRTVGDKIFLISNAGWVDCLSVSQARRLWKSEIARQLATGDKFLFCADEKCIYVRGNDDPTDINTDQGNGKIYAIEQESGKAIWKSDASFKSDCNPLLLSAITKKKPGCVLVTSRDLVEGYKFIPNPSGKGKKYIPAKYGPINLTIIDTLDGRCSKQVLGNACCAEYDMGNPYRIFAMNNDQNKLYCWWQTSANQNYLQEFGLVSKANGFTLVQDKVKSPVYASPKISGLSGDSILISTGNNLLCLKPANLQPIWQYDKFEHYNWETNNNLLSTKSKKKNLIALAVVPAPNIMPVRTYPRFWEETSPEIAKKYVQDRNHHKRKVVTLDAASGKELWSKELICLEWIYSDGTGKIFAVSHKGLMLCLDADSGKDIWLYENPPMRKRKHHKRPVP